MSRSAESHVQLASGGKEDLQQLFALSFAEPTRHDDDLRHAVLDYVRNAKAERRTPEMVIVSLKRAIIDAAAARISDRADHRSASPGFPAVAARTRTSATVKVVEAHSCRMGYIVPSELLQAARCGPCWIECTSSPN